MVTIYIYLSMKCKAKQKIHNNGEKIVCSPYTVLVSSSPLPWEFPGLGTGREPDGAQWSLWEEEVELSTRESNVGKVHRTG